MREIGLKYKGRRKPFYFKNPRFEKRLEFTTNETVVWVEKKDADWFIANNPRMFDIAGERDDTILPKPVEKVVESQPVIPPKPVVETELISTATPGKVEVEKERYTKKARGMPKGGWPSMRNKKDMGTNDNRDRS